MNKILLRIANNKLLTNDLYWDTNEIDSLVREKGLLRNFFRAFKSE